ncbi:MAG TPA: hypothetical protein VIG38_07260 [Hyphomicrobium sp.]|jgi:hypothetical protein
MKRPHPKDAAEIAALKAELTFLKRGEMPMRKGPVMPSPDEVKQHIQRRLPEVTARLFELGVKD